MNFRLLLDSLLEENLMEYGLEMLMVTLWYLIYQSAYVGMFRSYNHVLVCNNSVQWNPVGIAGILFQLELFCPNIEVPPT